ncbi:MAG: aldo/keto reductase [Humibacillus sp.]|nr:aldo/keto reductase [Humibacillus sp.]MDN5777962.1 aldo/keto reductase [Humibacillus sp.]
MTYRQLGDSGLTVSTVGLGCNNFGRRLDQDATTAVVRQALDSGVTLFDTADIYGVGASEELLGVALGSERESVVVATKFGMDMQGSNGPDWGVRGSRRYIRKAVEASLRRLGTDWIDLYQLHRPDPLTPIEETLAALAELVREGKVRYLGSSNFTGWQVVDADWTARAAGTERFVSAQNEYSLLEREVEEEVVPACEHVGVGLLPFFPLASGLLTGKYRAGEAAPEGTRLAGQDSRLADADWDSIGRLEAYAAERGIRMIDVAIGGLAAQPGVASVIAGATNVEQVVDNVAAGSWEPTADDLVTLDEITAPAE